MRAEGGIGAGEFLELPLGNFHHDVIDGGLKTGRRLLGNVVGNFVQRHAHREASRDFGDGKASGLGGQGGTARDAGVHLDHNHAASGRLDSELNIGPAGLDADFPNDGGGGIAHALIFLVGEGLRGSHGDGVAGVDAHGIEIFDRADDHEVVADVAHDFQLELFPAEDGLFDEGLMHRAGIERQGDGFGKLFVIVGDGAAGAAERKGGPNDNRVAELVGKAQGIVRITDQRRHRHIQADFAAGILELETILGHFDGPQGGADQLHPVSLENAAFGQFHGKIQTCLATNGGKQSVGTFAGDDLLQHFMGERLDISAVGKLGIGHDGGGIGIHQDDFVAVGTQRLAGLSARIVEFAGLPDDDRTGADDQNFFNVRAFGH